MADTKQLRLILQRPLTVWDWCEDGPFEERVVPAGGVVALDLSDDGGLFAGSTGDIDHEAALQAAAVSPCQHFGHDSCDCWEGCTDHWLTCDLFGDRDVDDLARMLRRCKGDATKCCSSKVRKEAFTGG